MNPINWMRGKPKHNTAYSDAVLSLADYLVAKGFAPEDAMKTSEKFWSAHQDKLRDVL